MPQRSAWCFLSTFHIQPYTTTCTCQPSLNKKNHNVTGQGRKPNSHKNVWNTCTRGTCKILHCSHIKVKLPDVTQVLWDRYTQISQNCRLGLTAKSSVPKTTDNSGLYCCCKLSDQLATCQPAVHGVCPPPPGRRL